VVVGRPVEKRRIRQVEDLEHDVFLCFWQSPDFDTKHWPVLSVVLTLFHRMLQEPLTVAVATGPLTVVERDRHYGCPGVLLGLVPSKSPMCIGRLKLAITVFGAFMTTNCGSITPARSPLNPTNAKTRNWRGCQLNRRAEVVETIARGGLAVIEPLAAGDTPGVNKYCVLKFAVNVVAVVGATLREMAPASLQLANTLRIPPAPCGEFVAIV
jgi:hypothetical protein